MPVVNVRNSQYQVYIGRTSLPNQGGYFGNPFMIGINGDREEVIKRFREYAQDRMYHDPEYRQRVKELHGKTLGCFCAPAPCHGDVLLDLAAREQMVNQQG